MRKLILLSTILSTAVHADLMEYGDANTAEFANQELTIDVPKKEAKKDSKVSSTDVMFGSTNRQQIYLDTLERLEQIERVNQLPATSAGGSDKASRPCQYAKNVLLEYELELDHPPKQKLTDERVAEIKRNIDTWQAKIKSTCIN